MTRLTLVQLGVNTYREFVVYIRADDVYCTLSGFCIMDRVRVTLKNRSLIATLHTVDSSMLSEHKAGLSQSAWAYLYAREGDEIELSVPQDIDSLPYIQQKIEDKEIDDEGYHAVINDIDHGNWSDLHIASWLTACAAHPLKETEIIHLTEAMVEVGDCIKWPYEMVVDKHCVGGLPGNRTTPIVVSIVAAYGMKIPKSSSRSITSPSGTADTMEVITNVKLTPNQMKEIVEKHNGCLAWGGYASLSPVDDLMIRVEQILNIDSESQLIASILSKKIAAGSNHLVIDIPIGKEIKTKSRIEGEKLKDHFKVITRYLGLKVKILFSKGDQPVGFGIGPALEATDILNVLKCKPEAPPDLRQKALKISGMILEFSKRIYPNQGIKEAEKILDSGLAYAKFKDICKAQGRYDEDIPEAKFQHKVLSMSAGKISEISNKKLVSVCKIAGAPFCKTAGVKLNKKVENFVSKNDCLMTIYSEHEHSLQSALNFLSTNTSPFIIKE